MKVSAIAIDPVAASTIYAGTDLGIFQSLDAGVTWTPLNNGLADTRVTALAIDPSDPSRLYAGTRSGFFISRDTGASWKPFWPWPNLEVTALALFPDAPSVVYVATVGGGIYQTFHDADFSHLANRWLDGTSIYSLAFDPQTPLTLYAGTPDGILKSVDGGVNWHTSYSRPGEWVLSLAVDPSSPETIYAATAFLGGFFESPVFGRVLKSSDFGATWTEVSEGLPVLVVGAYRNTSGVSAVVIDPRSPSILFAATEGGVVRSPNGGARWFLAGDRAIGAISLALDGASETLYAGTYSSGAFVMSLDSRPLPLPPPRVPPEQPRSVPFRPADGNSTTSGVLSPSGSQ